MHHTHYLHLSLTVYLSLATDNMWTNNPLLPLGAETRELHPGHFHVKNTPTLSDLWRLTQAVPFLNPLAIPARRSTPASRFKALPKTPASTRQRTCSLTSVELTKVPKPPRSTTGAALLPLRRRAPLQAPPPIQYHVLLHPPGEVEKYGLPCFGLMGVITLSAESRARLVV